VVEPSGKAEKEKSGFARKVEDATLTAKVKYRLILNKNIASYDINVDTEKGVVILSGKVDSPAKRDLAVKLAENTSGVDRVRDNLTVVDSREMGEKQSGSSMKKKMEELSQDMKDTWITAKARSLLLVSAEAEGADYDISTENGKVTVAGTVMSRQQAEDIQKILEDLQGVRKVENNLKVREQGKSV
jgi:hyperosmotically inducible protein